MGVTTAINPNGECARRVSSRGDRFGPRSCGILRSSFPFATSLESLSRLLRLSNLLWARSSFLTSYLRDMPPMLESCEVVFVLDLVLDQC